MTHSEQAHAILREEEFALSLDTASQSFGAVVASLLANPAALSDGPFVARLSEEAHALETFLDDHGARQNRTFVVLGELVASIRGLARVRLNHQHLAGRLSRYELISIHESFFKDLTSAGSVLDSALLALGGSLVEEAGQLDIRWSGEMTPKAQVAWRQRQLPRNLDADNTGDEKSHLATLGARFLAVVQASRHLELAAKRPRDVLVTYVAEFATEDRCRWYESAVHNIQSMYDTHVLGTATETDHPWLRKVRGHASVALHLLEMATDLVHFYERHENDIRHPPARDAIAAQVSKGEILNVAVNVCLHHAYAFVDSASGLADRILATFLTQQDVELTLPDGVTLHARPLALIVQVAKHHRTPIEVTIEGRSTSANSLMSLIMLAGQFPQARAMRMKGAVDALRDLRLLFESGLGEGGAELPEELGYLDSRPR